MKLNHHAFLIPHRYDDIREALRAELSRDEAPEIIEFVETTFPIDRARALIDLASRKSEERGQVFIVAFDSILHEAQNSLLKLLEEPTPNTYLFVVTPNPHLLFPTVKSRLAASPFEFETKEANEATEARIFFASDPGKRLELVKQLIDDRDRIGTERFLRALVIELEKSREKFSNAAAWAHEAHEASKLQSYAGDPASSPKMLLEHAAAGLSRI